MTLEKNSEVEPIKHYRDNTLVLEMFMNGPPQAPRWGFRAREKRPGKDVETIDEVYARVIDFGKPNEGFELYLDGQDESPVYILPTTDNVRAVRTLHGNASPRAQEYARENGLEFVDFTPKDVLNRGISRRTIRRLDPDAWD